MQLNMSTKNTYGLGVLISAIFQMFVKLYIEGVDIYLAQKSILLNMGINIIYGLGGGDLDQCI